MKEVFLIVAIDVGENRLCVIMYGRIKGTRKEHGELTSGSFPQCRPFPPDIARY